MKPDQQQPWLRATLDELDETTQQLDPSVCAELEQVRLNALHSEPRPNAKRLAQGQPGWLGSWQPLPWLSGATACAALLIWLGTGPAQDSPEQDPATNLLSQSLAASEVEKLDAEQLALLDELDFYTWLEAHEGLTSAEPQRQQDG